MERIYVLMELQAAELLGISLTQLFCAQQVGILPISIFAIIQMTPIISMEPRLILIISLMIQEIAVDVTLRSAQTVGVKCETIFHVMTRQLVQALIVCTNFIISPGSNALDCLSHNFVYFLTCSNGKLKYVGETALKINERFNWHRSYFKYPHYGLCHSKEGLCKNANHSAQITENQKGERSKMP